MVCAHLCAYAQTDTIRYVHPNGAYGNNGLSWATAKNRVQDAINDLYEYMLYYNLTSGSVYIAAGTYLPTESTESSGGSMLNTSFKIYGGIHVYGGFNPDDPEEKPGDRIMANGKKVSENWSDPSGIGTISADSISSQWDLRHKTILTGNHSTSVVSFTFDSIRGRYNTTYPASSYHVIWFATNGKYDTSDDALMNHFKPLEHPASLDGCVISSGNASSRSTTTREHTAYGGGVYMVGNTSMRACIIERCNATMRGGGIYADGGGDIEFCYIHTCQSPGVGVVEGYGGGVCIDQEGSIGHSQISCCAARCGGGLMICHDNDNYPWAKRVEEAVLGAADTITSWYSPHTTACVINNNTANAEGGGIYLTEGGTVNHATVCGNSCTGRDVTYYGRRHGRTGGIYVRNCGMIFNSVFWGNRCDANNDIQFASVRQKSGEAARGFEIFAYHTAFMNHDITDWTGVTKESVYSLDHRNMPVKGSTSNHPCFFSPTVTPLKWDSVNTTVGIYGAGVLMHMRPVDYPGPRIWHLTSYSALDQKGVQWNEAVQGASPWLIHAHTDYGVVSNPYEPVSTLGALVRKPDPLTYELVVPQSAEYRKNPTPIPTLFVDPNRKGIYDKDGNFVTQPKEGDSWNVPIKDLGEAISFFRKFLVADEDNRENHHFMIPALDTAGMPTGTPERYDYVQILVKEGTLTTVGPGNYLNRNIRTAAVRMESHMRMYGGYPSTLTGVETEGRNPRKYKSFITANITGESGASGYQNNAAHVIAMVNCEHTIVDGFTLEDANTHNIDLGVSAGAGGGLLLSNASIDASKRIHMVGNQLRNSVITNCTAPRGAAIFVDGSDILTNNGNDTVCYAELMLVNCIIRNNTADYTIDEGVDNHGIITANGRAYIHTEHCTVVNNVGFPFKSDEESAYKGYVRVDNTIVFCNSDRLVEDNTTLGDVANVLSVNPGGQDYVFGKYNMFDTDLVLHKANKEQPHGFFQQGFTVPSATGFLPDGISSHFVDDITSIPSDTVIRANKSILTRTDNTAPTFPTFVNPSRNVGHSTSGDKPLYGGTVTYAPMTTNPVVNAAGLDEYTTYYDFDRSDVIKRDRGGAPDVGAVENTDLPEAGTVIYVTPDGAGKRDGSSWDNAIAGNTIYAMYGAEAAGTDELDEANGTTRIINSDPGIGTGAANGVTTTDNRYCGGYARKYMCPIFQDKGYAYVRGIEVNVYAGGANDGLVDTLAVDTTSKTALPTKKYVNGKIPEGVDAPKAINAAFPYGEMSGASRYIYRAEGNYTPFIEDGTSPKIGMSTPTNSRASAENLVNSGQVVLTNERKENYVSGLQYAVEKASMTNKSAHKDSVQVWVGAGKYSDYKGFVMRDSVSVYGGFPAGKYKAPGMAERRALMSAVVSIPKSKENEELDAEDYETILQISDVNPKSGTGTSAVINPAAVKFYDEGQSVYLNITNNISQITDNNTIHYYQWDEGSGTYILDHTDNTVTNSSKVKTSWSDEYYGGTAQKRYYLRKRVLQMPDVTSPIFMDNLKPGFNYGNNNRGIFTGDHLAHFERVIKEGRQSNVKAGGANTVNGRIQDPNYKEYNKVYWDGFTIRHGFLTNGTHQHTAGAGVAMFEGARLVNCIVTDNFVGTRSGKGGGVSCDGSTSTIENCFILNNTLTKGYNAEQSQMQGAGLFLYEGTCFNTLIANNWANGPGGGLALCVAKFYNNTVAYNYSNNSVGGVRICTGSEPAIFMANTIIYGNNAKAIDITSGSAATAPFINCYVQSVDQMNALFVNALTSHTPGVTDHYYGRKNTLLHKVSPNASNTPFKADVVNGAYTGGSKTANDFALRQKDGVTCINAGEEDFVSAMYEAVREYLQRNNASLKPTDAQIKAETFYKNVVGVELPKNDVVYAKRIQDCQVDIGAYEYNAAYNIMPDTTTHPGHAIFYTTYIAPGGDASARSPENAACMQKLQLVLDAAGRYKYSLMTEQRYDTVSSIRAGWPGKDWSVEVWLEGDSTGSTVTNTYKECYTPTRSTRHSEPTYQDNTLDYSFMVPHGVCLKGGFKENFYHYEDEKVVDDRDPLTFRTVLSGNITSSTGATGQTYHVVTFVNDLFRPEDEKIKGDGNQLATLTQERDRAVLDGLFIMDGKANAPDEEGQCGGACIVTGYAHVRNCVIQNNSADTYGGGLYLKPQALVSGTIVKNNTANVGGGIYVEAPANGQHMNDSLAHVFYSTICENTGRASAGGIFFDNTYARINSSAIWHNSANDNANVAGNFARSADTVPYPMNCCAVESRRLEGQGNIELSPRETEGVRWDHQDPFDAILYYPIEMSSTLARAGISYTEWNNFYTTFATLDSIDIAGVSRTKWHADGSERGFAWDTDTLVTKNNDVIDIGARAINKDYEVHVDPKYVMHRLYVVHTELIDSKAARTLQDNTETDAISNMYRQMGSCILNPFHRLSDAFEYIIKARMMDSVRYRNTRFEVFVEQGTYYPMRDAYMRQGTVRMNTFLVPEAILLVGGVDSRPSDHKYGQEGFKSPFSSVHLIGDTTGGGVDVPIPGTGYTINFEYTDSIRLRDERHRPMRDNNLNSVIEPWELERQTILSGNAVAGEDFTHIYHVVTCHADKRYVGPRPLKFAGMNSDYGKTGHETESVLADTLRDDNPASWVNENDMSILARTIGFDGLQITGGYANHVDSVDTVDVFVTKTYFRGGGIYVDGNWWEGADTSDPDMTQPALHNIPIVVENCYFTNNMAGNGGAIYSNGGIYAYGNRFTQNYSQGPMTKLDQKYIPWTAGGCIATNAFCGVSNTLFDNNEARRGLYPLIASSADAIPNADARQGFGGCLSIADKSLARVMNCHFMKNKAVAYSAMYNFYPNNRYSNPDSMQYAFNTIFWGNEVFEVGSLDELEKGEGWDANDWEVFAHSRDTFDTKYKPSRAGVFHYDGAEWDKYENLFAEYDALYKAHAESDSVFHPDVIAKLMELREQGNKMEGLYFCSYRKTYGPTGMKPSSDGYLLTRDEHLAWKDPRSRNVLTKTSHGDKVEDYTDLWTQVSGNNNTLINRINTATDGPNFKQPSFVAGIDGYMQNADWLQARMNITTDQGWGYLEQKVVRGISYYITRYTGTEQFATEEAALAAAKAVNPSATKADVFAIYGLPVASFKPKGEQPDPGAMYNFLAWRYGRMMSESNAPLPLGDQYYMHYTRSTSGSEMSGNMDRISKNPKIGIEDVYIDLGIYEYQYVQLDIKGQEIDTVWVATKAKDPVKQDGLSWETPTTDLQSAIDLLMSSHNNHDKYVCFLGNDEGETFSPQNVLDNRRAFVITSNSRSPLLPDSALADFDYGVNSLNFLGGYSYDVKNAQRDPLAYPTVIEMPNAGNESQRNQLFVIEDMTRQMFQANFVGEYTSRDSVVIPIVFDGITFVNPYSVKEPSESAYSNIGGSMSKKGGAAIYYRWQRRYEGESATNLTPNFNMALHPDSALIDGAKVTLPKLTISNCVFMDNGKRTTEHLERSPAVRIDHGGGSSLIVNTLFHSNAGAPVYARTYDIVTGENNLASVPNDVFIINCTSALNDGHIRLESENSEVHNSLIWLDDLHNDTLIQLQMGTSDRDVDDQWDKITNKNRPGIEGRMTHNAVWGCFQVESWGVENSTGDPVGHNHPLSTDNNNVYKGPGFFSPYVKAATSEQRRERSFRLNPSIRTMNMADTTVYRDRVFFRQYPDRDEGSPYWRRSNGFKDSTMYTVAQDFDLATNSRYSNGGMERGAYECLVVLQRVLYVRPEMPAFSAGDGSSWSKAFGQGQLQNAIDAAAVYTYMNQDKPREDRKAYVFVKGTGSMTDHYNLVARDGVYVYGSLPGWFNDTAWIDTEKKQFTNEECRRFKNYVRASTSGVGAPNAPQTRISSIHITGDEFKTGFLLDGFVITNPTAHSAITPVLIDNEMAVVRNCLIVNNTVPDHPVADVRQGLLYNCLFYNDSAQTIVRVGADGLALNNTIVTNNAAVTPIDAAEAQEGALQNNISGLVSDLKCFASYLSQNTPYTLPAYLKNNASLAYQLHEHSAMINAGTMDNALPALFDPYREDSIIMFKWDRDILGNPRKIGASVDKGALETWYVAKNNVQEISAITNQVLHTSTAAMERDTAFTLNNGGHRYPHPGSVVYLMDSAAMTMQYANADFIDFRNQDIIFSPGYLMLKPGASFYGNGYNVQLNYVAAEKRFTNQRYSMTAFPFNYSKANITVTRYVPAKDSLGFLLSPFAFNTYQYSGAARSQKDYVFQTTNSSLWLPVDTLNRTATDGYLMDFGTTVDTVLRFTAFAPAGNQYVYTEEEDTPDKVVYLTQYDNRVAGTGADLNFTRQEDMGWNMKGLPWLVSGYRTDTILEEGNYQRQMFIPHVFYQMDGAPDLLSAGDQMYTARSWDRGTMMSMGKAFFTQTATTKERESVYFHLPYYGFNEKASRPILRMTAKRQSPITNNQSPIRNHQSPITNNQSSIACDFLTVLPDAEADKQVRYNYGRDGIKWLTNDSLPHVYLMDSKRLTRISLLDAAPVEVDIPMGVSVPDEEQVTFSLPDKEAYEEYSYVWIIDHLLNRTVNLLHEDYEAEVNPGQTNDRFALRFGGFPLTDGNNKRRYVVYTYQSTLFIRGLVHGDKIDIYTPAGQIVYSGTATSTEWSMPLFYTSGYIVKVNDTPHKVLNM